ncbi:aminotransferase class I/II-fold pyridoxal phosphate-dependent enzyme [Clostridium ganghwense]|uniref:Aminotransferase n=1 Tax=Clostridium ganghwense TaxID=312089 RepID=A0ABT4CS12_9CLOT|nr:aminotransferase class I/II-fold pyridoxal phosphate-dependent enzyme [Clostridium ganghwense]MCY6371006.1 aminotransferase class I/II-fold pyridoxal phosphate-dependent enzyme [Clostridium ganghwense]
MNFSRKMEGLTSAIFSQLRDKKEELLAQGQEVIDFSIGSPDILPAPHIVKAIEEAVADPLNYRYAVNDLPELTEMVIKWYDRRYGVELKKEEIVSLQGSQEGLAHIALTLVNEGDTVLTPDPGYPIFNIGPFLSGAKVERIPLLKKNNYIMDLDSISSDIAYKTKMMIVSYPNNPTTAIAPMEFYEKLVWFAKKYDIAVIHDNAYNELVFDNIESNSFLSIKGAKEVGVEFNSLSKTYSIPGMRIAFALGNKNIIRQLRNLKSNIDYGVFLPVQRAAIAALSGPQDCVDRTREIYKNRGEILVEGLKKIGWEIDKSKGTMFLWALIPDKYTSSIDFTFDLLEKTGVIVVPGSSFGNRGEGFVRFALVQSEERILKAIENIDKSGILK